VYIDGIEYDKLSLSQIGSSPQSWAQEGELLYVHYAGGFPAWLFYSHSYGAVSGFSTGKTRFFDGVKFSAGLDIKLQSKIEADNLEYAKIKLNGGAYSLPSQGGFDDLTSILGNNIETSYSLDGVTRIPFSGMFVEEAELTLGAVNIKAADKREKLNASIAGAVFTAEEYPKMKEDYYGKNKQEALGYCRGVPAVCLDGRDIYGDGTNYNDCRTFRAASVITRIDKVEVKMTQPKEGQNKGGDVWVNQTAYASPIGNGCFTLPALRCLPLLTNGQPDYGNEPYEARVTGMFLTDGAHLAVLSYLLETAMGRSWRDKCDMDETARELSGTGTVGIFIEKETKIVDIIETLQSSGVYGWQLHDYRGRLTARRDDNGRGALADKKIKGVDILNINETSVKIDMNNYATLVQVKYQRNYSENSNNVLQDNSNRTALFSLYRSDKTYTAESYLESPDEARARCGYLLNHFAVPRLTVNNIKLSGAQWLGLRIYDIIGVYLEQEIKTNTVPALLMVLSNELRRQEVTLFGGGRLVEYVMDGGEKQYRKFGGNIYIKIMRIDIDISMLTVTIDGMYTGNISG
jgi:hypothetical protein